MAILHLLIIVGAVLALATSLIAQDWTRVSLICLALLIYRRLIQEQDNGQGPSEEADR